MWYFNKVQQKDLLTIFIGTILILIGNSCINQATMINTQPEPLLYFFNIDVSPKNISLLDFSIGYDFDAQEGIVNFVVSSEHNYTDSISFQTSDFFHIYAANVTGYRGASSRLEYKKSVHNSWNVDLYNISGSNYKAVLYFEGNTSRRNITPSGSYLISMNPKPEFTESLFTVTSKRFRCDIGCFSQVHPSNLSIVSYGSSVYVVPRYSYIEWSGKKSLIYNYEYFILNFKDVEAERNQVRFENFGIALIISSIILLITSAVEFVFNRRHPF